MFSSRLVVLSLVLAVPATAAETWTVRRQWVEAHENFLAGPALRGRGSASGDEAIAAAYVAAQFQAYGLAPAPGAGDYLQSVTIVRLATQAAPRLTVGGKVVKGVSLLRAGGADTGGEIAVMTSDKAEDMPSAAVVVATSPKSLSFGPAAQEKDVGLFIIAATKEAREVLAARGGKPRLPSRLDGEAVPAWTALVTVPPAMLATLAKQGGKRAALTLGQLAETRAVTTNAVAYLPGRDPAAPLLLVSAHLDHLGVREDGVVMPGANDDASGTVAVLELAHALAAGSPPRRGVLFVAYGSEELGGYGSRYFAAHPPVPLDRIAANIEFEMIGAPDPKLPAGALMMTGSERSDLIDQLRAHGTALAADPYKAENFFQRSDNYQLAVKGIVAHTISGWAVPPTYHQPTDTVANLDLDFMTRAIQSLVEPLRALANSAAVPRWRPGGQPEE